MQNELTYNDHSAVSQESAIKAQTKRREEYSLQRDIRAREDNEAIAKRLAREKEKEKQV